MCEHSAESAIKRDMTVDLDRGFFFRCPGNLIRIVLNFAVDIYCH